VSPQRDDGGTGSVSSSESSWARGGSAGGTTTAARVTVFARGGVAPSLPVPVRAPTAGSRGGAFPGDSSVSMSRSETVSGSSLEAPCAPAAGRFPAGVLVGAGATAAAAGATGAATVAT